MAAKEATKEHATGASPAGGTPEQQAAPPPVNCVQTITIGAATAGNFSLAQDRYPTPAIPYNPTAAQLQAALQASQGIGPNNVAVTGTNPFTVTYQNGKGGMKMTKLTVYSSNLTPPATPITIALTTQGNPSSTGNATQDALNASWIALLQIHRHGNHDWPMWELAIEDALRLLSPLQTTGTT